MAGEHQSVDGERQGLRDVTTARNTDQQGRHAQPVLSPPTTSMSPNSVVTSQALPTHAAQSETVSRAGGVQNPPPPPPPDAPLRHMPHPQHGQPEEMQTHPQEQQTPQRQQQPHPHEHDAHSGNLEQQSQLHYYQHQQQHGIPHEIILHPQPSPSPHPTVHHPITHHTMSHHSQPQLQMGDAAVSLVNPDASPTGQAPRTYHHAGDVPQQMHHHPHISGSMENHQNFFVTTHQHPQQHDHHHHHPAPVQLQHHHHATHSDEENRNDQVPPGEEGEGVGVVSVVPDSDVGDHDGSAGGAGTGGIQFHHHHEEFRGTRQSDCPPDPSEGVVGMLNPVTFKFHHEDPDSSSKSKKRDRPVQDDRSLPPPMFPSHGVSPIAAFYANTHNLLHHVGHDPLALVLSVAGVASRLVGAFDSDRDLLNACLLRLDGSNSIGQPGRVHQCQFPSCGQPFVEPERRKDRQGGKAAATADDPEERPFACRYAGCGKRFTRSSILREHERVHTGERPYACTIPGCTKRFKQSHKRNVHMRSVHGQGRVFECQECGKKLSDSYQLKRHLQSHTGEKPYVCEYPGCYRRFSDSINLRRHQQTPDIHKVSFYTMVP